MNGYDEQPYRRHPGGPAGPPFPKQWKRGFLFSPVPGITLNLEAGGVIM